MNMNVSIAQMDVATADPEANLKKGEFWVAEAARRGSDVICMPEMWTTGFDWNENRRLAADQERVIERIGDMAERHSIWIGGSVLALDEDGRPANTFLLFDDRGRVAGRYGKIHLFGLIHEDEHLAPGKALCAVETPWGTAGLSVCYDIRFPELFRSYALRGAKFIFTSAAFPAARRRHWRTLLRARAIENQLYMIGVNQTGGEELGADGATLYGGSSAIIDPWGEAVVEAGEAVECLLTATLDIDRVDEIRGRIKVLQDRRPDLYERG